MADRYSVGRWLAVAAAVCVLVPACSRSSNDRGPLLADKDIDAASGGSITYGDLTIRFPPGALSTDAKIEIHSAKDMVPDVSRVSLPLGSFGSPLEITAGKATLQKPATMTWRLGDDFPKKATAKVVFWNAGSERWTTVRTSKDPARRSISASVTHFSVWTTLVSDLTGFINDVKDTLTSYVTVRDPNTAKPQSCGDTANELRMTVTSDRQNPPLFACWSGEGRLTLVSHRPYPLDVYLPRDAHPSVSTVKGETFASLLVELWNKGATNQVLVPAGGTVTVNMTGIAWPGLALTVASSPGVFLVDALLAGTSERLAVSGRPSAEVLDSLLGAYQCAITATDTRLAMQQCNSVISTAVDKLARLSRPNVAGVVSALVGLVPTLANGLAQQIDNLTGFDRAHLTFTAAPAAKPSTTTTATPPATTSPSPGSGATVPQTTPPPSPATTLPTTAVPPTSPPNRRGISSYDQMRPGAPYWGGTKVAWQPFTAQSNTITYLSATVGHSGMGSGPVGYNLRLQLCTTETCSTVLGETNAQILNYGVTGGDIGDVRVSVGATYYIVYTPPNSSWDTYWWGGSCPSTGRCDPSKSDQMQAQVQGYNQ